MIREQGKKIRQIFVSGLAAVLTGSVMGFFVFAMTASASGGEIQVDIAESGNLEDGYYKIASDGTKASGTENDYNVHYDSASHTLTLKDVKFRTSKNTGIKFTYSGTSGAAVIELIGENEITSNFYGINADRGGSLPSTGADVEAGLTIKGSGTLKINSLWGIQAANLTIDGSTLDLTTRGHSALNISRDLVICNGDITTHDGGDGGDFYVARSLRITDSKIDISNIQVEYPSIYVANNYCPENLLIRPALVIERSSLTIGGWADSSLGFSVYISQGGAEISDSVLNAVNKRAGICAAKGALEISGSTTVSTGEKLAVRGLEAVKIGEGVEITGARADGKPLVHNGLICMPGSITEEELNGTLHYYGGGTVKLGDKTYHSVRFDLKDGTPLDEIETQWIPDGNMATAPSDPQMEGASFTGWTESGGGIWKFEENPITKSMIFFAGWKQENTGGDSKPSGGTGQQPGTGSGTGAGQQSGSGSGAGKKGASANTDSAKKPTAANRSQTGNNKPDAGSSENGIAEPFIKGDNGKEGWDVIREETAHTEDGGTVAVDMNGTVIVPGDVLDDIKGRDITIVFDMGGKILWSVNGQSITADKIQDIDFSVKTHADMIPIEVINNVTGELYSIQLSLAHSGEFGFTAVLSINMEEKNAGLYANLFYYNETEKEMEFICADEIAEDGTAELAFTHASSYAIIIDTKPMNEKEEMDEIHKTEVSDHEEENRISANMMPEEKAGNYWWVLVIGVTVMIAGVGYFYVRKRKKETEE